MNWNKYGDCDGQLNLFDFIKEPIQEPMLKPGDVVYIRVKADLHKHIVEHPFWLESHNYYGYHLDHNTTWDNKLHTTLFIDEAEGIAKCDEYIKENRKDIILADELHVVKAKAYTYTYFDRFCTSFIAELDNGLIYCDYSGQYAHLSNRKWETELAELERTSKNKSHLDMKWYDCLPESASLHNMYKCEGKSTTNYWIYAKADYLNYEI